MMQQQPDGSWVYASDVYRLEVDAAGRVVRLQVRGQDFLQPAHEGVGGAVLCSDGEPVPLRVMGSLGDDLSLVDGQNLLRLHPHPDYLDLDLGQEVAEKRQEWWLFPAAGIQVTAVPGGEFRGLRTFEPWERRCTATERWTAPDGTAIEVQVDAHPVASGVRAMACPYQTRKCGQLRFPASAWGGYHAVITMRSPIADHHFPSGWPLELQGEVTIRQTVLSQPPYTGALGSLTARLQLLELNTIEPVYEAVQPLTVDPASRTAAYRWAIPWDRPGPWGVRMSVVEGDHELGALAGVVVYDVEHYLPPLDTPPDFWEFWEQALARQRELPLAPLEQQDADASTVECTVTTVFITGNGGRRLRARYAEPTAAGRYPVALTAGYPGQTFTGPRDRTVCRLSFDMDGLATFRTGLGDRGTANLYHNYLDAARWVDYLATRKKADLSRSIFFAGSRSGPIGLALLALEPRVRMYIASVPTNNRWDWQVTRSGCLGGWGPWFSDRPPPLTEAEYLRVLAYFDPSNFVARVTQPVLIGFGLLDRLSQPTGNLACFARLASPRKKIVFNPWAGHSGAGPEFEVAAESWRRELWGC